MRIKCSFCEKVLAKSDTKSCGSCKAVIYCSRDCQKGSWRKDHKEICARISNPQNANDELRLWCTFWAASFEYATVWALDIKNNPGHNTKHALMVFVKKVEGTDPAHRYRIFGQCFVPLSLPKLKYGSITPGSFHLSVQDPDADDGFGLQFNNPSGEIFPYMLPRPSSALLAKLAVPILRHLTKTFSHVDAITMWDANVWLSRPHPSVKPEDTTVLPEEIIHILK